MTFNDSKHQQKKEKPQYPIRQEKPCGTLQIIPFSPVRFRNSNLFSFQFRNPTKSVYYYFLLLIPWPDKIGSI